MEHGELGGPIWKGEPKESKEPKGPGKDESIGYSRDLDKHLSEFLNQKELNRVRDAEQRASYERERAIGLEQQLHETTELLRETTELLRMTTERLRETTERASEAKDRARPNKEVCADKERRLKASMGEARTIWKEIQEFIAHTGPGEIKVDREKLQYYLGSVDMVLRSLDSDLQALKDDDTSAEARLRIAIFLYVNLKNAVQEGQEVEELYPDTIAAEHESKSGIKLIGWLQQKLARIEKEFWELVTGLLKPKEWTLKGEGKIIPFLAKGGIEIKFGA